jgi:hypothetical protein
VAEILNGGTSGLGLRCPASLAHERTVGKLPLNWHLPTDLSTGRASFAQTRAGNSIAFIPAMNRIATKKTRAFILLLASTLLSYARIVWVVLSERLWHIPQRHLRTTGEVAKTASRRLP